MKLPLKYIVVLVITALVCIFVYQAYWLVGLYQSQKKELDAKIISVIENAHFVEMQKRVEKRRKDESKPHGQLSGAVAFSMDEDEESSEYDNNIDQNVKVRKVNGGKTITDVHTTFTKEKKTHLSGKQPADDSKSNDDDKPDQNLVMIMSGKLTTMVQQALFSKLNELEKPDIHVFDSALVAKMLGDSLLVGNTERYFPHRIQFMRGKKVMAQMSSKISKTSVDEDNAKSAEYIPSSDAKQYQYVVCNEGEPNEEKYVLTIEPMTMSVLSQMTGILSASLIIMLILVFVFWYLIHTMLKQKTLDEMKSDFTNNITHELKTPIAVAYAANDALLNYGMMNNPEKMRKYLGIAQEQLLQLSGMVEQILSMSMERRKTMLLNIVDVPIKEVIEPLISQHQLKAQKKVEISLAVEPESLKVQADRMHFSNIVSNLIDNAIKYSGNSVKIEIHASQEAMPSGGNGNEKKGTVVISVKDNGIGIAHDKLPYIFDKFYRVTDGNKYSVKGYGLGLFYVKSLMEKMGGSVTVESELGKGSCFELRFK